MTDIADMVAAQRDERKARQRFLGTAGALAARLRPFRLVEDAATGVGSRAADIARRATKKARARPATIAVIGCFLVAVMVRRRVHRLIRGRETQPDQAGRSSTLHVLDKQHFGGGAK